MRTLVFGRMYRMQCRVLAILPRKHQSYSDKKGETFALAAEH
jgi:hypothetical protein